MSCCAQRRHAATAAPPLRAAAAAAGAQAARTPQPAATQRLRYLLASPLSLRGPFSGRVYQVDARSPLIDADAHDAPALLRTALFAREP